MPFSIELSREVKNVALYSALHVKWVLLLLPAPFPPTGVPSQISYRPPAPEPPASTNLQHALERSEDYCHKVTNDVLLHPLTLETFLNSTIHNS